MDFDEPRKYVVKRRQKSDRTFDILSGTDTGVRAGIVTSRSASASIFGTIIYYIVFREKITKRGRYFYYTKDTARIARSGLAGNDAYYYSLNDPNADVRPLTKDEMKKLNAIEIFAYRNRRICFWVFVPIPIFYATYIFNQYANYENLWPMLALPLCYPIGLYWMKLISVADGCTIKILPDDTIAFGNDIIKS